MSIQIFQNKVGEALKRVILLSVHIRLQSAVKTGRDFANGEILLYAA